MQTILALVAAGVAGGVAAFGWSLVVADADEWVVQIRNGRCVRQGVGIRVLRWPGDTIVRFSSTVQRVRFTADVLTEDRLEARVDAFLLWSISDEPDGPFVAFRRLGLVNLAEAPPEHFGKHLLTRPQYRAFQQAFAAYIQEYAGTVPFDALALHPQQMADHLRAGVNASLRGYGVVIEDAGILSVRPSNEAIFTQLQAPSSQAIREQADTARMQTDQRLAASQIQTDLALEAQRAQLDQAKQARADADLDAWIARDRAKADAEAERIRILAQAEQDKSEAVRAYELERLRTEQIAEALGKLPLKEARWFTVGEPLETLRKMLE